MEEPTINNVIKQDFESRLFKRFVLPGIVIEFLLLFLFFVPTGLNINVLSHSIGGPAGISAAIALSVFYLLLTIYLFVAGIYSVILPYRYYRRREIFVSTTRKFLTFSNMWVIIVDVLILLGFVEYARWNLENYMNLPVIFSLTGFTILMTCVFFYWTDRLYKYENLKITSKESIKTLAVTMLVLLLILIVPYVLLIFF